MDNSVYKSLGLVGFAVGWLGISLLLVWWDVDKSKSISHHAAANRTTYTMMAILETISLTAFALFTTRWLAPNLQLPAIFSLLTIGTSVGLTIAAWVPVTGPYGRVHDFCAYMSALFLIPTTLILALSPELTGPAKVINIMAFTSLFAAFIVFATNKKVQERHLIFQSIYILVFDLAILAAVYLR